MPSGTPSWLCPKCLLGRAAEPDISEAPPPPAAPAPGSAPREPTGDALPYCLGAYELLERIGQGGMGVVYKARQISLERLVAVKVLSLAALGGPEVVHRFRTEATTAGSLQHPNIVAVHEVGLAEGQHYLVMDYVPGPTLADLAKGGPLPARRAAQYLRTIAEAVHFAHDHGILHRDLKPSNVLIDANDQPRVTDFGLAKRLEKGSEFTLSGQVLGSPAFIPPEQASGQRGVVGRRSDVYALGAILYYLLTGRPPFVGEALADTLRQVLHEEPVELCLLNPAAPLDLRTICLKCLEKEPDRRYPTAQALAEELGRFLENRPILARPLGPTGKAWRWFRRNPRLAFATSAALLSLLIGLAGVIWQWRRAEAETRRAEAETLTARRNAYAADMKGVQWELENNNLWGALDLLNQYRPRRPSQISNFTSQIQTDLRGWEWRYLWARCQSDERFLLHQYSNAVSALAFSPDGKWLAVRQEDAAVALWDAVAMPMRLVDEQPANADHGKALAFAENLLAWDSTDAHGAAVVNLRHVNERSVFAPLPHSSNLVSLAFSPDAKVIATLACDGTVLIWDVASQQVVTNFPSATVDKLAETATADTELMATLATEGTVGLRETNSATLRLRFSRKSGFTDHYGCVLFSPDSRLLAAGCGAADHDVHVWDVETRTETRLVGHRSWIAALAFSPNGQTLASAGADQTIRLWDVARRTPLRQLHGDRDEIWAIAWSPNGQYLVTGAKDGSVRCWDPTAKTLAEYTVLPATIWSWGLTFLPDSKTFLTVTRPNGAVVKWDTASLQKLGSLPFLGTNHSSMDLSQDHRWLALCDTNGNIQVWNYPPSRLVTNLVFPETWTIAVIFSPRGGYLHCGGFARDGQTVTKIWEVPAWREVSLQGINLKHLAEVDFSPNERTVAIGYKDGTAAWWDIVTRKRLEFFACHFASTVRVRFSPDGRRFATAGMNGLLLYDVATRKPTPIGLRYRSGLHDLVFSPDGRRLITTGTSPKDLVKFWDVETIRDLVALPGEPGLFSHHIGFSPDGNTLFADSIDGIALLWRAPSWAEIEAAENKKNGP